MIVEIGAICRICSEVTYSNNPICGCTNIMVKYLTEAYMGENIVVFVDDLDTIEVVSVFLNEDTKKLVKYLPMVKPQLGKAVYYKN